MTGFSSERGKTWIAALVELAWEDPAESVHVPAMYFDELIHRDNKRERDLFISSLESFVGQASAKVADSPFAAASYVVALPPPEYFDDPALTSIGTTFTAAKRGFRTKTLFRPRRRATALIQLAFWAYWDSLIEALISEDQTEKIPLLLDNLLRQAAIYGANGLPPAGVATVQAMAGGAGDRAIDRRLSLVLHLRFPAGHRHARAHETQTRSRSLPTGV